MRPTFISVAYVIVLAFCCRTTEAATTCSDLKCIKQNFEVSYAQDYEHFWAVLNKSADEAKQCRSIKKTAEFLDLVRIKIKGAEFEEFFAQTTENLCVSSPRCFKRASKLLDKEAQKNLVAMLDNPLFVDRESLRKAGCLGK